MPQYKTFGEGSEGFGLSVFKQIFQSSVDLDIHENLRKEDPSFKFLENNDFTLHMHKNLDKHCEEGRFLFCHHGGTAEALQPCPYKIS